MSEQKPEHMTDAEWEALQADDGVAGPDDDVPVAGDEELGGEDTVAGAGGEDTTKGGEGDDTLPGSDADDKAKPPAPLLVAQPPENADAQLKEIKDAKAKLADDFDNGELSTKDYTQKVEELNDKQRAIELAIHEANIAAKMNQQQARNAFLQEVDAFTADTPYKQSAAAWKALDEAVKVVARDEANAGLTGRQILEKAHERVLTDPVFKMVFEQTAKKGSGQQQPPGKKTTADLPPNLSRIPSAEMPDVNGDKFAKLDRLFQTDPLAYEKAVGALSESDRDAYLARG